MALVVEDGTGKPDAESYASVAAFKAYCDLRGLDYTGRTDPQIEQALRRGSFYIDVTYGRRFPGSALFGRNQGLAWPRVNARLGPDVLPFNSVPREVVSATIEAALRDGEGAASLFPEDAGRASGEIKQVKVGDVTTEFFESTTGGGRSSATGTYPLIDAILAGLLVLPGAAVGLLLRA